MQRYRVYRPDAIDFLLIGNVKTLKRLGKHLTEERETMP